MQNMNIIFWVISKQKTEEKVEECLTQESP